jgi:hypothetical protein
VNIRTIVPILAVGFAATIMQAHADTRDDIIAGIQR